MSQFCPDSLYHVVSRILNTHLIRSTLDLVCLYQKMINHFDLDEEKSDSFFEIAKTDIVGYGELLQERTVENLGIDLPIYFGDSLNANRIMIVAMDPKRNGQVDDKISIGSVFALHQKRARQTNKNDYWKFIEPLTKNNFVYLTDIYKLYYETYVSLNGKQSKLLSNKDPEFTALHTEAFQTNKLILEEEIKLVKPTTIIALGNESANALKLLSAIKTNELEVVHNGINYLFMPHISRTVTQNITTIANLFITMGKLKNNEHMMTLGEQLKLTKEKLYK